MKIYLTLLIISVLTFTKGSAQFSNGSELLNFCKLEYGIKNKSLVTKKWIQEKTNNYIDDRGVKYSKNLFTKGSLENEYILLVEEAIYPDSNTKLLTTTLRTTNGASFDKLIEGIENLGYLFKPLSKGKLFANSIDKKLILASEIINIDKPSTEWIYLIKIIYNPG